MAALIAYVLGPLTAVQAKNKNRKYADNESRKGDCKSFPDFPIPVVNIRPAPTDQERAEQQKENSRKAIKFWAEVAGIVVLIVYTGFTIGIYFANQKAAEASQKALTEVQTQTTLMRQQLVGTQAAVVSIIDYPGIEQNDILDLGIRNDGHVIAHKIDVKVMVSKEGLSHYAASASWECGFQLPILAPSVSYNHQCTLKGLSNESWRLIKRMEETIAIDGTITYDNGFEIVRESFCRRYVPQIKTKYGMEGSNNFLTCDQFRAVIEHLHARQAEQKSAQ